jgi:L-threonate 2-dehydrogenase
MASTPNERVGVIGLGAIGQGIATNLLKHGYEVLACEPIGAALANFEANGGVPCSSARDVAAGLNTLLVCVFNAEQAHDVLFGPHGALDVLAQDAVIVMHTTMSPTEVRRLADTASEGGRTLLDAPVTGGKVGADNGTLTVIVSGPPPALEQMRSLFDAYSQKIYEVGGSAGAATTIKMVNQLLNGVNLVCTAEALAFAVKAGADPATAYEVVTHGTGNSRAFESRASVMLERDFETVRGALEIFTKDLGIVEGMAKEAGFDASLAKAALERFRRAEAAGLGKLDTSAVLKTYESED